MLVVIDNRIKKTQIINRSIKWYAKYSSLYRFYSKISALNIINNNIIIVKSIVKRLLSKSHRLF